jgi:hypothetical protein
MNATFTVDNTHEIEIRGDGSLIPKSEGPACCSQTPGHIGIQVNVSHWQSLAGSDRPAHPDDPMQRLPPATVAGFTLTRSQARAVASMLLTAAQEAR